jgi:hypothetical protein
MSLLTFALKATKEVCGKRLSAFIDVMQLITQLSASALIELLFKASSPLIESKS